MKKKNNILKKLANKAYEFGFVSKIKTEIIERGLSEDTIRLISEKKKEPEWLLEFRLQAYRHWLTMKMPTWAHLNIPPIDYQAISYYADPLKKSKENKNKEIDPELMKTFEKLGIPLEERLALSGTAVDAVMDSVSVKTTFKEELKEKGILSPTGKETWTSMTIDKILTNEKYVGNVILQKTYIPDVLKQKEKKYLHLKTLNPTTNTTMN